jgi:hypothetical protein
MFDYFYREEFTEGDRRGASVPRASARQAGVVRTVSKRLFALWFGAKRI